MVYGAICTCTPPCPMGPRPTTRLARIAGGAGLDFVVITDHNIYEPGLDGWVDGVLVLVGEEVHDPDRQPQSSHLLCFDIHEDVAGLAADPQAVIDAVASPGRLYLPGPSLRAGRGRLSARAQHLLARLGGERLRRHRVVELYVRVQVGAQEQGPGRALCLPAGAGHFAGPIPRRWQSGTNCSSRARWLPSAARTPTAPCIVWGRCRARCSPTTIFFDASTPTC